MNNNMKKIVQRTCIGCNIKKEKKELLRLVLNNKGDFLIDLKGKAEGRGTYICKDIKCLEKIEKSKKIEKIFGIKLDEKFYNNLRGEILKDITDQNKKTEYCNKLGGDING